jgi:pimeloyl-ACP methyl ester carboxylesterase
MATKNVVLVHGGFVDGSGWRRVYDILRKDGHDVSVVQNPTLSLDGDVEATKRIIDAQDGPAVLVGHSYGGAVITGAGNGPNVAALVYIAAFAPDEGESVNTLIADPPPDAPVPPILPPQDGFLFLDGRSSMIPLRATWMPMRRRSWRIRRSRGGSMPWAARSAIRPGGTSRAGISSRPRT